MKRIICLVLSAIILLTLGSCGMGEKRITDINRYGEVDEYIDFPKFFPESIDDYTANSYSYTLLSYFDTCYEIFLDITVTEEQFDTIISDIRSMSGASPEREAYYADGYYEIVFQDSYEINEDDISDNLKNDQPLRVWSAKIEKVIYNPSTCNIVFECFDAFDSGVYLLDEVAYFNRFGIDQHEYAENLYKESSDYDTGLKSSLM